MFDLKQRVQGVTITSTHTMTSGPRYHDDFNPVTGNGGQSTTPSDDVKLRLSTVKTGLTNNITRLVALEAATASGVGIDQSARDHIHDVENVTN